MFAKSKDNNCYTSDVYNVCVDSDDKITSNLKSYCAGKGECNIFFDSVYLDACNKSYSDVFYIRYHCERGKISVN